MGAMEHRAMPPQTTLMLTAGFLIRTQQLPPYWYWLSLVNPLRCAADRVRGGVGTGLRELDRASAVGGSM